MRSKAVASKMATVVVPVSVSLYLKMRYIIIMHGILDDVTKLMCRLIAM